jgi:hypothetical protein
MHFINFCCNSARDHGMPVGAQHLSWATFGRSAFYRRFVWMNTNHMIGSPFLSASGTAVHPPDNPVASPIPAPSRSTLLSSQLQMICQRRPRNSAFFLFTVTIDNPQLPSERPAVFTVTIDNPQLPSERPAVIAPSGFSAKLNP